MAITTTTVHEIDNSSLTRDGSRGNVVKTRRRIRDRYSCFNCGSKHYRIDWCKGYYLATCLRGSCGVEERIETKIAYDS